jgi:peptidoglycan-associated lipoprotein
MKAQTTISLLFLVFFTISCSASSGGASKPGMGEGGTLSDEDLALSAANYGDGNIPQANAGGVFADIYFGYDSSVIAPEYQKQLQSNAQVLASDPSLKVEVEGHCDSRGTNEYNLALGEERAKAVASMLVNFGANPKQISTISYGEEIPIDPSDNEQAYQKNRRVHFALYRSKN